MSSACSEEHVLTGSMVHRVTRRRVVSRVRTLKKFSLFKGVDHCTRDRLGRRAVYRTMAGGEVLFKAGDSGDSIFLVVKGQLQEVMGTW